MARLALLGGPSLRSQEFPAWPYFDHAEETGLLEVLRSGSWGGYCTKVGTFEEEFAQYVRAGHCISLANGTVALEVALAYEQVGPGDEVIVPPFTFMATASAVLQRGAIPVFADIEPSTLNIDPFSIEQAITDRTRAIIPVHFAGHSASMTRILEIARRRNLVVIEDAAHAHGGEYRESRLGSLAEWGSFSFQLSKVMTAGEGGCLVTNDAARAEFARSYCNQGRVEGGAWYDHFRLGTNLRITGFQAAVLLSQLDRLDHQLSVRGKNARVLRSRLCRIPGILPLQPEDYVTRHAEAFFLFRFDKEILDVDRQTFRAALEAEGIPVLQMYPRPLYRNAVFDNCPYRVLDCSVTEAACDEVLALPLRVLNGPESDMDDVIRAFAKIAENVEELRSADRREASIEQASR